MGSLVALAASAVFSFWPQGGLLGQDLYFANSVDADPAAGATLDPWCGHRTYDTHGGEDITFRSFREIALGVPVFSMTDGTIVEVQDGFFDFRSGPTVTTFDNHLIVKTADDRYFVYGHLRRGLKGKRGQVVHAGQQIAWSASSGNSSWPHLHLTELVGGAPHELFPGPCNTGGGDSFALAPFRDSTYLRNVVVSPKPLLGRAQLPWDEAARTGTFVTGTRDLYLRLELGEYAGGGIAVQILRGDTPVVSDDDPTLSPDGVGQGHGLAAFDLHERVTFDRAGAWTLRVLLGGAQLAAAPLRVVDRPAQVQNRPPYRVGVDVSTSGGLAQCVVKTQLAVRDPDYDLVRYRYRWTAGGKVLRTVASAMLSDIVRVPAGTTPRCQVTPSDGRLSAAPASG